MNSKYFKIDAKLEKGAGVTPFYGTVSYEKRVLISKKI